MTRLVETSKNPLHADFYPDRATFRTVAVEENVQMAEATYRVRLRAPEIAQCVVPGQFFMLRNPRSNDPLLARPLALYDTTEDGAIDIVYLALGRFTKALARAVPSDEFALYGPLGNGFRIPPCAHLIMVAGGIGQTPFMALARQALGLRHYGDPHRPPTGAGKVTLCYGARKAGLFAAVDEFLELGVDVRLSTDDGSAGSFADVHPGTVADTFLRVLAENDATPDSTHVVTCGPEAMMAAIAQLATDAGIRCQVSLETPMACGIGICFSCVAKVRQLDGTWDYKRTCVEGPVFDAESIVWD